MMCAVTRTAGQTARAAVWSVAGADSATDGATSPGHDISMHAEQPALDVPSFAGCPGWQISGSEPSGNAKAAISATVGAALLEATLT